MEKKLNKMKIFYVNIRGYKSKQHTLELSVKEHQPDIIGIVETHLEDNEKIKEIEGYEMMRNDRNNDGGGVAIAVKEEYI